MKGFVICSERLKCEQPYKINFFVTKRDRNTLEGRTHYYCLSRPHLVSQPDTLVTPKC
jgi:hypothetical protein